MTVNSSASSSADLFPSLDSTALGATACFTVSSSIGDAFEPAAPITSPPP
eukprot:CAMPEP_0168418376 /NCGR_PEP_ID=MMETSP0228-20121227/31734_1 /TAXON_ID=133427 /ORGANISM="Protoceratium reticulatum, Strain CCCM 535 (=CCMP 1889)" /LENGTH=49 /DNA_ID= /DNA_START= /DNA_END= /DNA_ORIENTATION=